MSRFRWIDDVWWRDWVLWLAVAFATVALGVGLAADGPAAAWWWLLLRWAYSFAFAVAVLGFGRTVVRTYRAPSQPDRD